MAWCFKPTLSYGSVAVRFLLAVGHFRKRCSHLSFNAVFNDIVFFETYRSPFFWANREVSETRR